MKNMKRAIRHWWGRKGALKREAGYVLAWVLILTMVASFVMVPFLHFMLDGLTVSHSYADTMGEFYAADSGIEDATYKIKTGHASLPQDAGDVWGYYLEDEPYVLEAEINGKEVSVNIEKLWTLAGLEGITELGSGGIDDDPALDTIPVDSTDSFPSSGVIRIEDELIEYSGKDGVNFTGCVREYDSTTAVAHAEGTAVSLESVPSLPAGLTVVGQVTDEQVTTTLTGDIDDDENVIPVASTDGFPLASELLPALIRIGDEIICYQYVDRGDNELTVFDDDDTPELDGRGVLGTVADYHDTDDVVTVWSSTYQVDFTYDNSYGSLNVDRMGVWLPSGFSYVPGSSNVFTELDSLISDSSGTIPVLSTALFSDADETNPRVIAIEDELIEYDEKDDDDNEFGVTDDGRGYQETDAILHYEDTLVSAEPNQISHHGGIALEWDIDPAINFMDLQTIAPPEAGEWQPGAEFPFKRTLTFRFSPARLPKGIVPWIRTTNPDAFFSWDSSSSTYKITSTATDPESGTQTTVESCVSTSELTNRVSQVFGDAVAIGNSLMKDEWGSEKVRETLIAESTASLPDTIPEEAVVEAAYLYWSGWQSTPNNISSVVDADGNILDEDAFWDLVDEVDNADFTVEFETSGTVTYDDITASRTQLLNNDCGWSFSCFKDVTDLLEPVESVIATLSSSSTTESVTITNQSGHWEWFLWWSWWVDDPAWIDIEAGTNPGNLFLDDGTIIAPGTTLEDYRLDPNESVVLTSGSDVEVGETESEYVANISTTSSSYVVDVGGVTLDSGNRDTDVSLTTTLILGRASITQNTATAEILVEAITIPAGGYIDGNGDDGTYVLDTEGQQVTRTLLDDPDTLDAGTAGTYQVLITCTSGMVTVVDDTGSYTLSAGDAGVIPVEYTVGDVNADPGEEVPPYNCGQYAYAGWSLIIIYSDPSPTAEPHRLFLYDNFLHAAVNSTHYFTIAGFRSPEETAGSFMTCFVGEGDDHYEDDFIEFRAEHDAGTDWNSQWNMSHRIRGPLNLDNAESPWYNVWNGQSPGFEGLLHEGVDIDTFDLSDRLEEGDTSADVKIKTWELENLIYIFISVPSVPSGEGGGTSLGVISYSYGGGG